MSGLPSSLSPGGTITVSWSNIPSPTSSDWISLAAQGLAQWVHPKDLKGDGGRLAAALEWALRRDRAAHARLVREIIPAFDGATRLTRYLARWLGGAGN